MNVWYRVSDLDQACDFYVGTLGFREVYRHDRDGWIRLARDGAEFSIAEGRATEEEAEEGQEEAVVTFDVADVRAEADRLRAAGVPVGVVVEIPGTIRLLDVFDPDGNRVQLSQDL